MTYIETVKSVLFHPKQFFDEMPVTGGYKEPLKFALISITISFLIGIFLTLIASITGIMLPSVPNSPIAIRGFMSIVISLIFLPFALAFFSVGLFGAAAFNYILLRFFGGRGDYEATFRVSSYIFGLISLFVWIPLVNFLVSIYGFYLEIIGFSKIHQISKLRVLFVLLVPVILVIIFAIIIAGSFLAFTGI